MESLTPKVERQAGDYRQRVAGSAVDAGDDRRQRGHARVEVVLGFEVVAVGQVVEAQVEVDALADGAGEAEVENRMAGGDDRRVVAVEAVVIDGAHAQRPAPAV